MILKEQILPLDGVFGYEFNEEVVLLMINKMEQIKTFAHRVTMLLIARTRDCITVCS